MPSPALFALVSDALVIYVGAPVALALVGALVAYLRRGRRDRRE